MSEPSPTQQRTSSPEGWLLFRAGVPLIAAGIGPAVLYAVLASRSGLSELWVGPPLMLAGAALGALGIWRRSREIRGPGAPSTRHYWMLFLGWALVVAGLVVPGYLLA